MNRVGILCALQTEAQHLGPVTLGGPCARLADGTLIHVSGMGPDAASQGARALVESGAAALASWGLAGALAPTLAAGDILIPEFITAGEGTTRATTADWRVRLSHALSEQHRVMGGMLLSRPAVVRTAVEKTALFRTTGAIAVDMESLAVAAVADDQRLPFIAVRVIVDRADDALPVAVTSATDAQGRVRIWRMLTGLMAEPAQIPSLLRLSWRYRAARQVMAAAGPSLANRQYAFPPSTVRAAS
ncbi:MAG TPA: hypothetical protein VMT29_11645 [Steroidobacteraceae bacterium]|nr:hypothetical protein [Steroidobacteraceae bacterium]